MNDNELYHYGVPGMRWGVRRYQNSDGSLTKLGKIRYGVDESGNMSRRGTKLYNKHRKQYLKNPDKASFFEKRYQKTFDKVKNKGLSDIEADKIARGKVRSDKTLIAVGATAAAAIAGIGIYRYIDRGRDVVIKAGQEMQTVHTEKAKDRIQKGRAFYASYTKKDNAIYSSRVFSHVTDKSKVTKFTSDNDVKIASIRTSRKTFNDLMRDSPDFRESVRNDPMLKGRKGKELFDRFQYQLVLRDEPHAERSKMYYRALSRRGYGGLIDNNDSVREGFTYKPVILFGKDKKTITSSKLVSAGEKAVEEYKKAREYSLDRQMTNKLLSANLAKSSTLAVGSTAVAGVLSNRTKFVKAYKQKHPNTTLSSIEIAGMYDNIIF